MPILLSQGKGQHNDRRQLTKGYTGALHGGMSALTSQSFRHPLIVVIGLEQAPRTITLNND
jgi:hypothetical protein